MPQTEKDFEEFLRSCNKHRVRYCIVGAYAVAFHAIPRYTKDLDILIEPTLENGRRVICALQDFGFGSLAVAADDFAKPGRIIQLGVEPVRIDLLTAVEGCSFAQIWKHRVRGAYGAERVWFIGRAELIRVKRRAGRPLDRVDLEKLAARPPRRRAGKRTNRGPA